jgi:hypothetical protein
MNYDPISQIMRTLSGHDARLRHVEISHADALIRDEQRDQRIDALEAAQITAPKIMAWAWGWMRWTLFGGALLLAEAVLPQYRRVFAAIWSALS